MSKLLALFFLCLLVKHSLQVPNEDENDDKGDNKDDKDEGDKDCKHAKIRKAIMNCKGAKDQTVVNNAKAFKGDPKSKELMTCFLKAVGAMNKDGVPQKAVIKQILCHKEIPEAEAEKLVTKCGKKASKPTDTAYNMLKCLKDSGVKFEPKKKPAKKEEDG